MRLPLSFLLWLCVTAPIGAVAAAEDAAAAAAANDTVVHHVIRARIEPAKHHIEVTDRLENVTVRNGEIRFAVGRSLKVSSPDEGVLIRAAEGTDEGRLRQYVARPADGQAAWGAKRTLTLQLAPLVSVAPEQLSAVMVNGL